ncbi:MAG: hypothetical protein VCA18_10615, partial [Opitutales bacterium]
EGRWKVVGNTMLTYDENGMLEWVSGILEIDAENIEYYETLELAEEYEINTEERTSEDWQLPDPPKGLPKLEEVSDEFIDGDANISEGDEQNASDK